MHYPNEVELYEPSIPKIENPQSAADRAGSGKRGVVKREVEIHLPCGYFNVWKALYQSGAPVSSSLTRFLHNTRHIEAQPAEDEWDSRISYSSADDEYYMNGIPLPFIKAWNRGMLAKINVFRKVEHDWLMAYIAPIEMRRPGMASAMMWRFNYIESRCAVRKFSAVLSTSVFSESAEAQWYIRPLTQVKYTRIPNRMLTAEEAAAFPEIPKTDRNGSEDMPASETRESILEKYRGQILMYRAKSDENNEYIAHTVPFLAVDLTQYVEDDYGFELGVSLSPASEGDDKWQKVQIARQSLRQPVSGRVKDIGSMSRCGLDFRIKLASSIRVDPVSNELSEALDTEEARSGQKSGKPKVDDSSCNFTVCVNDPENTIGSLQPPIRAHESVLAAGSDYFAALLGSSMTESASKKVVLDGMAYGSVRLAVNYLYTSGVANDGLLDLDEWIVLLGVASRLAIPRLFQLCQKRIFEHTLSHIGQCERSQRGKGNREHYMTEAKVPDPDFVEDLLRIAEDTGAGDLSRALKQLTACYPVQVCERRMRNSAFMVDFMEMPNPMFGHMQPQERGRGFWPPVANADNNFHTMGMPGLMAGPVVHPELVAGIFGAANDHAFHAHHSDLDSNFSDDDPDNEPTAARNYGPDSDSGSENWADPDQGGFLAHFMGNWRVVDGQSSNARPEPPQPGPAPSHPEPSLDADADADADAEQRTRQESPQDERSTRRS
ncbi:protein modification by small protein conjugation or removal [Coemansia sp. RSA 1804]|nr:protein modification by small protein conjugation or removal [Coemansia sp. RSA 1804]